ncbi:hypothetical protein BT96DRAFT_1006510 [Gymnopus androsaceus JB14]|uniref:Uncharacterized protein n=1 Tax=Gymnopus androsaceus JB14 TaxID=1447944 RepID=A0A6A4GKE5_9AGAR|nr:hypothetical protein BT96DRAFT_1006510 [Gymnopus androsaceus JB14]
MQSSTVVMYEAEFNTLKTDEERVAWLESMKKVKETWLQHATLYHQWEVARNREQNAPFVEHLTALSAAVVSQWTAAAGRVF